MSSSTSTGAAHPVGGAPDASVLERGYRKATCRLIPLAPVGADGHGPGRPAAGGKLSHRVPIVMLGLTLATMGALTGLPMFWPLPAAFLGSAAAAGGLALINSLGQIAGFISPFLVGWIKDATGSTDVALYILSAVLFVGAALVMTVPARLVNR